MEVKNVAQYGNSLEAKFSITNYNTPFITKISPEYVLNNNALFQVKVIVAQVSHSHSNVYNNLIMIRFTKIRQNDDMVYILTFISNELNVNKCFISGDDVWHLIHENKKQQYNFDVVVQLEVNYKPNSFASLHDDNDLTDFELRGEDGSVQMHKAVLAVSSPVLRRMLCGTWKETTEGHVDVPGISKMTLQHLKDYLYLHKLPDTNLEQLLLLSSYYMMPDLEQRCVDKIMNNLTAQNACELLEFAAKNKVTRLTLSILECVQQGSVKVREMRDYFSQNQ